MSSKTHSRRKRSPSRSPHTQNSRRHRDDAYRSHPDDRTKHRHNERAHGERRVKQEPPDQGYEGGRKRKRERQTNEERQEFAFGKKEDKVKKEPVDKQKPNFELSGKLTEDANTFKGVVIKYNEPPEARKPKKRWRWYPFKGETSLPVLHLHRQSAYLLGRDRRVADIPTDHPSCSKQHAVLQFRMVEFTRPDGSTGRRVRPYIIDLNSGNGTFLNNVKIEPQKYVELKEKDVVKFGFSSREFVLLHDATDTTGLEEDEDS